MTQRILVVTRGTSSSAGALRYARAFAERGDSIAEVLSIVPVTGLIPMTPLDAGVYWSPEVAEARAAARREAVAHDLEGIGGPAGGWPVRVEVGPVVPLVIARAEALGASMILAGSGRHGRSERLLGGEVAVRLMHASHVPVLAVPEDAVGLPTVALVATDFSSFSWDAAVSAARVVGPGGLLHLLHVMWAPLAEEDRPDEDEWIRTYRTGAEHRIRAVARSLAADTGVRVETHLVPGTPGDEILALRERTGAGLIAVGSHGLGFFGRIALGSVSSAVVRGAPCAVLVAPPTVPARDLQSEATAKESVLAPAHSGSSTPR
jgi:nucleotide-binding universal stress UspA family protein